MASTLNGVCAIRFTPLAPGSCDLPLPGSPEALSFVSSGIIDATISNEFEAGQSESLKNGCDEICVSYRNCDTATGLVSGSGTLCALCPEFIAAAAGAEVILDGTDIVGYSHPNPGSKATYGVLQIWTRLVNQGESGIACSPTGEKYGTIILPRVCIQAGAEFTLSSGFNTSTFTLSGSSNPGLTPADYSAAFPGAIGGVTTWDNASAMHYIEVDSASFPVIPADSCAPVTY